MEASMTSRNPLTGLSGLQQVKDFEKLGIGKGESQSPYGAKWFATPPPRSPPYRPCGRSRNPLTGLSGLQQANQAPPMGCLISSRNPLTGLSGLQLAKALYARKRLETGRNPLTGLSGLQLFHCDSAFYPE